MAIHLQSGKINFDNNLNANIHSVPFKIHADCDAKVSKYFKPYIRSTEECLTASFRGYPLKGSKLEMPEGYQGLVLHETRKPDTDKDDRKFYVTHTFKNLTYWNWDKIPSKNDAIIKALDWIDIAEALHSPVLEE